MTVGEIIEKAQSIWISNKRGEELCPLVTVVLPVYSSICVGNFEQAVESVINQSFENWELIIVNDNASNNVEELIKFYMQMDSRISTIRHKNSVGIVAISQYEAYMKAKGDYIAYISTDNVWEKQHLMTSLKTMIKENVKCTYGVVNVYKNNNVSEVGGEISSLPTGNCINKGSIVLHREIIEAVGLFDPHISLTERCDWDLWIRISKLFEIRKIFEVVASEHKIIENEVFGDTTDKGIWVSLERMAIKRNESLLPRNFDKIDICETQEGCTELFLNIVNLRYTNFQKMTWYKKRNEQEIPKKLGDFKRIILVIEAVDATFTLAFHNICTNVILRPIFVNQFTEKEVLFTDYVLFLRNAVWTNSIGSICRKYGIQFGYYLDDNFVAMIKEKAVTEKDALYPSMKMQCEALLSRDMFKYEHIFMSTEKMKEYYEKIGFPTVCVLPPCMDDEMIKKINTFSDNITIAFMGGGFREGIFLKKVFPALIDLSERYCLRLVCPDTLKQSLEEMYRLDMFENISIIGKPRVGYLECIHMYRKENVNILIHTGEKNSNNKYKTKNALINAVMLGAILLTSDIEPYQDTRAIIRVNNSAQEWKEKIQSIICDSQKCREQYELQVKYVIENYSQKVASKILSDVLKQISSTSIAELVNRQENYMGIGEHVPVNIAVPVADTQMIDLSILQLGRQADELLEHFLSFQVIPKRKLRYVIEPTTYMFSQIGLVMAFHEKRGEGEVILEVMDGKKCIASARKDLIEIQPRQVNYFTLSQAISDKKKIKIVLSVNYEKEAIGMMGCYEVKDRKKMVYRICKKLTGIQIPVKNLPYIVLQ